MALQHSACASASPSFVSVQTQRPLRAPYWLGAAPRQLGLLPFPVGLGAALIAESVCAGALSHRLRVQETMNREQTVAWLLFTTTRARRAAE